MLFYNKVIAFTPPAHTGGDNSIAFRYIPTAINTVGANSFMTSQHLKMCTIIQYLLYHKICQISISEQVLRKILLRCNQWIYKVFQTLILLYTKLPYCTFYSRHSVYKKHFSPRKCTIKLYRQRIRKKFSTHKEITIIG